MPVVEFDLRALGPGQAPSRTEVAGAADAASVLVRGPVPALAGVLAALNAAGRAGEVVVSWEPADGDKASRSLARDLGIGSGSGSERELTLVRDDHGGVLLHHGRVEPVEDGRPGGLLMRRFGAQAHHDDARVADGWISRIDARPDWQAVDTLRVVVLPQLLRPPRLSRGRALQIACDPARVTRDGVPYPRPVSRWTWYADDRVRWRLQP